jgi:DNA-binding transcriptional ArsR family regulator
MTDDVFRALGDPTRRAILAHLQVGDKPVNDIAERFDMSRPAVSRHLRVLRHANLVVDRWEGRHRFFALNAAPLEAVDRYVQLFRAAWQQRLVGLKNHVEGRSPARRGS